MEGTLKFDCYTAENPSDRTIISICFSQYVTLNCFDFDFHISAEQFYDRSIQELVKRGKNYKSTNNAMSNNGSTIEIADRSHRD